MLADLWLLFFRSGSVRPISSGSVRNFSDLEFRTRAQVRNVRDGGSSTRLKEKMIEILPQLSLIFVPLILTAHSAPILINCGSNSTIYFDGRIWTGDTVAGGNFTLISSAANLSAVTADRTLGPLYSTARVFSEPSTYIFNVSSGGYFLRLHFSSYGPTDFDLTANGLKLLSRFNVTKEIEKKNSSTILKEFFLNSTSIAIFVRFSPIVGNSAFINAVELIPSPDYLFADSAAKIGRGMETMYRVNMGDRVVDSSVDRDLWRSWETDVKFMFSSLAAKTIRNSSIIRYADGNRSAVAPIEVYEEGKTMANEEVVEKRFNVTWRFPVEAGFDYLARLHFCELVFDAANQRVFRIFLDFKAAADNYDIVSRAGGRGRAYSEDFLIIFSQGGTIWLQLGQQFATDVLLNGLEIFKLSRNGNLASAPESDKVGSSGGSTDGAIRSRQWVGISAGIASTAAVTIFGAAAFVLCARAKPPSSAPKRAKPQLSAPKRTEPSRGGRRFSAAEIRAFTKNYDEALVVGTGGFGKVYKGELSDGGLVAVKRAHRYSEQGLVEFETEVAVLSTLRHRHLVSLIGYCDEHGEMILVYEYMALGTLRSHLYGERRGECALMWQRRLEACIGAARGLHYLHTGAEQGMIIHRDVKTSNILLDEEMVAKVADFGLSKGGLTVDRTHVSTAVKGSFGYLDPEYFRRQQLTDKSDVYSFGVVLFEVACARAAVNPALPKEQVNLAEWAAAWQRKGQLAAIADPILLQECSPESLHRFGEIALKCLANEGLSRPTMGEVLWYLERLLEDSL